ncbi:MAG: ATP-binding protein, partial [Pseudomonadota bacterium]
MDGTAAHAATLGAFVTIRTGYAIAIAQIVGMHVPESMSSRPGVAIAGVADIELVGELLPDADGNPTVFRRGVSVAPRLGDQIHMISHDGLSLINRQDNSTAITVGKIHQDPTVPAAVEIDEMLGKHFAIVGSTGTGKSCTVALLLRRVLERHPHAHIVLLDPHNEYASCFGQQAEHVPLHKLNLPYWCLTFEEVVEVLLGSKAESAEEVEVLRELIPAAKRQFALAGADEHASIRLSSAKSRLGRERFSVDVPLPYRMADLIAMIDEEMGKLEKQRDLNVYRRLKARIATVTQDPRFGF